MDQKPFFLLPCIWVYHLVLIPIRFLKYVSLGIFFTLYYFIKSSYAIIGSLIHYLLLGFIVMSYFIYSMFKMIIFQIPVYAGIGLVFILYEIRSGFTHLGRGMYNLFVKSFESIYNLFEKNSSKKEKNKKQTKKKKEEKETPIKTKKERKKKGEDVFVNEKEKLEKKSFSEKLKAFFASLSPARLVSAIKNKYNNSSVVNYINNKKAIDSEALLMSFEGEDAEKSETKILYEYIAKDADGKVIKGYFDAYSKVEVHSFLLSEGMTVYQIRTNKWITFLHKGDATTKTKIKNKDLIFFLTQLSTYLKAGITLVESLKILSRQYKNKKYQKIFRTIVYDLTMGDNFSEALEKEGEAFPRLLINMIKTSEMTGELPEVLDDMAAHYSKIDKTRKDMINALLYPAMVFVVATGVIIFIMLFVIPQFVEIYESMDASAIPDFTMFIMNLSDFLKKNIIWLLIGLVIFIIAFIQVYKHVRTFKTAVQWFGMHTPVFGNVIIYNEVTMFTKTLSSLLKHNVPIADSMDILNKMTNNEIYKMLILNTITNIYKGDKISDAFKGQWSFPVPAYEMIVTGERTGELPEMMEKVASYYQNLQESSVARIKTFIEPILIIFLTAIVGAIVLAIVIPMFNMYSAIQ